MKYPSLSLFACFALVVGSSRLRAQPVVSPPSAAVGSESKAESARNEEMLGKMRAAVEEIAGLYGNPPFVQIFTNSRLKADELRERLRQTETLNRLKSDLAELGAQKDRLANEVAQKTQEAKRLSERLVRQRAALESIAGVIEATNHAVEGTTP